MNGSLAVALSYIALPITLYFVTSGQRPAMKVAIERTFGGIAVFTLLAVTLTVAFSPTVGGLVLSASMFSLCYYLHWATEDTQ